MKKLIFLSLLFITAVFGYSQSNVDLRGDSVRIYKNGGHAELVIRNKTKDTIGVLFNKGNGVTEFRGVGALTGFTSNLDSVLAKGGRLSTNRTSNFGSRSWIIDSANTLSFGLSQVFNGTCNSCLVVGKTNTVNSGGIGASGSNVVFGLSNKSDSAAINFIAGGLTYIHNATQSIAVGFLDSIGCPGCATFQASAAFGFQTSARSNYAFVAGQSTVTNRNWQSALGFYSDTTAINGNYWLAMWGNGSNAGAGRHNAWAIDTAGYSVGKGLMNRSGFKYIMPTYAADDTLATMHDVRTLGGGGGGVASIPPNRGTGLRVYSPQIPAFNSIVPIYPLKGDSTTNSGSLTFYWDSSKSTIARGGVHFNLGATAIPDTLRLGGILDNDTRISGSNLYNLILDSGNFKIDGSNTLNPFPLDTTNFKLITRRIGDSALYEMSWPVLSGGSGLAIGAPVTNGGKQMSVYFGGTGGIFQQDSVHFRYDSTFQILTISGLKLGQNSIYQISTKDGNAVNIGNDLTGSSDNTRNLGTPAIKWKSTQTYGIVTGYVAKTANYTLTISDNVVDFTSGSSTATLPTAASITGTVYTIKNTGTGVTTVATTSSQTIDGATTYTLPFQYAWVTVQSNGSNWVIISTNNFQTPTTVTTIYPAYGAVNNGASTAGNPQYGGAYYSQGSGFVSSTSTEGGFRWYNKPTPVSTTVRNRLTFEANNNGGPYSNVGYISDELTGGIFHTNLGDFTNVNLAYQEISGTTDYASSPSTYTVCTSGTFTVTLRQVSQALGGQFNETLIVNEGSGTITVKGNGTDNITEGATTSNTFTLAQGKWIRVHVNAAGTAWYATEFN